MNNAASGNCSFKKECPIYVATMKKQGLQTHLIFNLWKSSRNAPVVAAEQLSEISIIAIVWYVKKSFWKPMINNRLLWNILKINNEMKWNCLLSILHNIINRFFYFFYNSIVQSSTIAQELTLWNSNVSVSPCVGSTFVVSWGIRFVGWNSYLPRIRYVVINTSS